MKQSIRLGVPGNWHSAYDPVDGGLLKLDLHSLGQYAATNLVDGRNDLEVVVCPLTPSIQYAATNLVDGRNDCYLFIWTARGWIHPPSLEFAPNS